MCLHTHVFSCMCIYIHGYFWETFLYSCGHLIYLKRSHQKYPPWCCLAMGLGWMGWYMTDVGWFLQNVFFATWFYQDPSVLIQIYWHPWPPMVFDEDDICTIFRFPYVSWSSRIYRDRVPIYIYIPKIVRTKPRSSWNCESWHDIYSGPCRFLCAISTWENSTVPHQRDTGCGVTTPGSSPKLPKKLAIWAGSNRTNARSRRPGSM